MPTLIVHPRKPIFVYKPIFFFFKSLCSGIMAEFPCIECCLECENNVLECSNCKNWVHRDCVQMSASAFRVWAVNARTFLCRKCCFVEDIYDAEAGLGR